MKPRNAHERHIAMLCNSLYPIGKKEKNWAYKHSLQYHALYIRKTLYCTECGASWKPKRKPSGRAICPECGKSCQVTASIRSRESIVSYFAVLDVVDDYQVVRICKVWKYIKNRCVNNWDCREVMQHYINHLGVITTMSLPVNGLGCVDAWDYSKPMGIHHNYSSYKAEYRFNLMIDEVYPEMTLLPIFSRNGYAGQVNNIPVHLLLKELVYSNKLETLLKCKQHDVVRGMVGDSRNDNWVDRYWGTIKICIRHNYRIKDFTIWRDYIDLLLHFKKDILNPIYVCPKNLKKEHDILLKKRKKQRADEEDQRRRLEAEKRKAEVERREREIVEFQEVYEASKRRFFDICMKTKKLTIVVLKSIEEFKTEGEKLNHCVFENEYYKKPQSLILSARLNEDPSSPIETVEVSLENMQIIQSRGLRNNHSLHHDSIVRLVNKNINTIAARVAV